MKKFLIYGAIAAVLIYVVYKAYQKNAAPASTAVKEKPAVKPATAATETEAPAVQTMI